MRMGKKKGILATLLCSFVLAGCGTPNSEGYDADRFNAIRSISSFTWNYFTEVGPRKEPFSYEGESYFVASKELYFGEGRVSETGLSTSEFHYEITTYPLVYFKDDAEYRGYSDITQYIEDYYLPESATYTINDQEDTVTIVAAPRYVTECFLLLDEKSNRYFWSRYRVYQTETVALQEPEYVSSAQYETSACRYIAKNTPLFQEVLALANKTDANTYYLANPKNPFYFADSGLWMSEHKVAGIQLSFEGNTWKQINYVRDSRAVTVTISNIGSTTVEEYPGTYPA